MPGRVQHGLESVLLSLLRAEVVMDERVMAEVCILDVLLKAGASSGVDRVRRDF